MEHFSTTPQESLTCLLKKANDSCQVHNHGIIESPKRLIHEKILCTITQALQADNFTYNIEKDTIVIHILYTDLLVRLDSLSAYVDAYSSTHESHLMINTDSSQSNNSYIADNLLERIIRNNPHIFTYIYNKYDEPLATDVPDDVSIRIEIKNGRLVSSMGWLYIIGPSFFWDTFYSPCQLNN